MTVEEADARTSGKGPTRSTSAFWLTGAGLLICMLCVMSVVRNTAWRSEATLLEDSVLKTPDKPRPYYNLGCIYSDLHRYRDAADLFTRSIEQYHLYNRVDSERSRAFHSNVYLNRGMAYAEEGRLDEAIEDYTRVLSLKADNAAAYRGRGACYRRKGETMLALKDYREACRLGDESGCAAVRSPRVP